MIFIYAQRRLTNPVRTWWHIGHFLNVHGIYEDRPLLCNEQYWFVPGTVQP